MISNASVNSVEKGFTVTVTGTLEKDSTNDADAGSAGGLSDAELVYRSAIPM